MGITRIIAAGIALASVAAGAPLGAASWTPPPGTVQLPLWSGAAPDPFVAAGPERLDTDPDKQVGGKPYRWVSRVTHPTLTLYRPKGRNTGAAVVVYPGGGYWILAIDLEGSEVCDWLTSKGIACVLVQYRVPGDDHQQRSRTGPYPRSKIALEDAQRAIALTRFHAREWGIDSHKIGVLGFSAGGHLVAATSTLPRIYAPVDAADRESVRPDFGIALYPGHLWIDEKHFALNPAVPVSAQTPPTFIVQNEDDPVDSIDNSLVYYIALKNAGVPVEMHLFANGGHAFGLRHTDKPATDWPQLAERWLRTIGIVGD